MATESSQGSEPKTKKSTTTKVTKKTAQPNRKYGNDTHVDSDTFKLTTAHMRKNISWNEQAPVWDNVDHVHYFHTIDSNGRAMTHCEFVGGHRHEVKVVMNDKGDLIAEVGPALDRRGNLIPHDSHTHQAAYLKSDKVKIRSYDLKAQAEAQALTL